MQFNPAELRKQVSEGLSQHNAVSFMKQHHVSTIEAIKIIRQLYSIDLGSAKQIVTSHIAYNSEANAAAPLHNALLNAFEEMDERGSEKVSDRNGTAES